MHRKYRPFSVSRTFSCRISATPALLIMMLYPKYSTADSNILIS